MELDLCRIFVKVVQFSSFSKAASFLKMPKSTVSKAITRLEKETGTKLLVRSTRSLNLTPAGKTFYDASVGPVFQLEEAQKSLYGKDNLLTGVVRITAPEDFGVFVIAPAISKLSIQHPMLRFEILYTDNLVDLIKNGYDLAVRIGRVADSSLKIKKVGEVRLSLVASPKYLEGKAEIRSPKDLLQHPCLTLNLKQTSDTWLLKLGEKSAKVSIVPKIISNQMSGLLKMALCDAGIALVPTYISQAYVDSGKLIEVLPGWVSTGWPVSLITPLAPSSSARLKATVDQILEELSSTFFYNYE